MEQEPVLPAPVEVSQQGGTQQAARESVGAGNPEAAATRAEVAPAQTAAPVATQPVQAQPVAAQATASSTPASQDNDAAGSPAVADDVDVIEKEWVDKAKKIVATTKDNPYQQEKEVSKLQADYLMKRYGKQVKLVE